MYIESNPAALYISSNIVLRAGGQPVPRPAGSAASSRWAKRQRPPPTEHERSLCQCVFNIAQVAAKSCSNCCLRMQNLLCAGRKRVGLPSIK